MTLDCDLCLAIGGIYLTFGSLDFATMCLLGPTLANPTGMRQDIASCYELRRLVAVQSVNVMSVSVSLVRTNACKLSPIRSISTSHVMQGACFSSHMHKALTKV